MSIEATVGRCARVWRRLGVPAAGRRDMAAELRADLAAAAADGRDPATVVGRDPVRFAREWAAARGEVRGRWRLGLVTVAVVLGGLPGSVVGLFVAYGTSDGAFASLFTRTGDQSTAELLIPGWLLLTLYAVGGVLAYLGALAATSAALRAVADPHRARTVRHLRWALPLAGVVGVALAMTYGDLRHFSTASPTPAIEALLAVAAVALAAATVRLAVRRSGVGAG